MLINRIILNRLLFSIILITFIGIVLFMVHSLGSITSQLVVNANKPVGMITKGSLFVQEFTVTKKYLTGIDLTTATWGRENRNTNEFVVLDSSYNILFRKKINSGDVPENNIYHIKFKKSLPLKSNSTLLIGIYSSDGDVGNSITLWTDSTSTFGELYQVRLVGPDLINALKNSPHVTLTGSFCLKTYESSHLKNVGLAILMLILFSLVIVAMIVYRLKISGFCQKQSLRPEKLFLFFAILSGLILIIVSPPISAPDEVSHFLRAYQVSQFNIFKQEQTIPTSLMNIFQVSYLYPYKKTSPEKILALFDIEYQPDSQMEFWTYDLFVPYIPQAIGIAIGKFLTVPPIGWLYLGRFFNLFFSILLIYFAIKIIPFGKWVFFFLALMPMTMHLMTSLSHDAMTIGLTFLLTAIIFKYAFSGTELLKSGEILLLFIIAILLSFCKPPYFITGLLFLLIPVKKVGSLKKYILIIGVLVATMVIAFPLWYIIRGIITATPILNMPLMYVQMGHPNPQKDFLLNDLFGFVLMLPKDIFLHHRDLYLVSFYGNLGWLELPLPQAMGTAFFVLIVLNMMLTIPDIRLTWHAKAMIFLVFAACIVLVQTASYLYFTPYGVKFINGVQGRYFIPVAQLFFLLFYGIGSSGVFTKLFALKPKLKLLTFSKTDAEAQQKFPFFKIYVLFFTIGFTFLALIYSVFLLITRFYLT